MSKIAMVPCWSLRPSTSCFPGYAIFSPTVSTTAPSCVRHSPNSASGPSRSSNAPLTRSAFNCCRAVGSSNEPWLGSIETAAWQRISKRRSRAAKRGFTSPRYSSLSGDWLDQYTTIYDILQPYRLRFRHLRGLGTSYIPRLLIDSHEEIPDMPQTVARLLAESLEAHDVDQVYCVPGESYVGLTSALIEKNSIRVIVCRHEGGAGFMAVADGRLRDRAGVAMVSRGPGLSNAMVSLHSAYHDATPVVMLIGQVERKDFGRLAWQEQNYSRLLSDVTKLVIEVNEPEQASEAIARAFHVAESGTPGPVAVVLPEDIFDEETEAELNPARPRIAAGPRAEDLDRLAQMLGEAERPLVLVGGALLADAVHDGSAFADLNRLSEEWVLPISPTHRRRNCSTRRTRTMAAIWGSGLRELPAPAK